MDLVRLLTLERAELEDHLAFQSLIYEYLKRQAGQLLGGGVNSSTAGGLLSFPSQTVHQGKLSTFSFSFMGLSLGNDSSDGTTRTPEAHLSRFDPNSSGHINYPLDVSGVLTGSIYGVFVRPVLVDSDQAPRRQFSLVTGVEEPVTLNTRQRERIEWAILKEPSSPSGAGWAKIFELSVSSSGAYTVKPLSFWDESNTKALSRITSPSIPSVMIETSELLDGNVNDNSHTLGLSEQLSLIRAQLARVIHAGAAFTAPIPQDTVKRWTDAPAKSLDTLSAEQSNQTSLINGILLSLQDLNDSTAIHRLYFRFLFTWNSTTSTFFTRNHDDLGCTVLLDAGTVTGSTGIGGGGMSSADFQRVIRRPVIGLPANSSTNKTWEVLAHNVTPVLRDHDVTPHDSLTDTATSDRQPIPFSYALTTSYPTGNAPLETDIPLMEVIPRIVSIHDHTNPSNTILVERALSFVLRFDPALVNNEFRITYDIHLTVREVDQ